MCAAAGAIQCTPPLIGTDYTFWIQQTGAQPFAYSMNFVVSPEPGTAALCAFGLLGLVGWRRRSRA
jgi:hypothetical protein